MSWSFRIARVAGTEVRVHWTFVAFLAWLAWWYYHIGGAAAAAQGVGLILLVFLCVVLHEFGHATAARYFGVQTPDITLLPIGGVARLQRIPDKPVEELIVAIAGPAVNVVIAIVLSLLLGGIVSWRGAIQFGPGTGILRDLLTINIVLVLFNLIPAFPMDGGRILRALLATKLPYARATQIAASVGQFVALLFCMYGLFSGNFLLIFIALFVYLGAQQEAAAAQMRDAARNFRVGDAMITDFRSLPPDATLNDAVEALLRTSQHDFPIVDAAGVPQGVLTRTDLIRALRESGPSAPVAPVMNRSVRAVPPWSPFDEAYRLMNEAQAPALLVTDNSGRLMGLVTPENVGEMMMVQSALGGDGKRPSWRQPIVTTPAYQLNRPEPSPPPAPEGAAGAANAGV
jgi:Zn-dependent protease/CBS domain-containing protein